MVFGSRSLRRSIGFLCLLLAAVWAAAWSAPPASAADWQDLRAAGHTAFQNADYNEAAAHFEAALAAGAEGRARPEARGALFERLTTAYFAAGFFSRAQDAIARWDTELAAAAGEPWVYLQLDDRNRLAVLVSEVLPTGTEATVPLELAVAPAAESSTTTDESAAAPTATFPPNKGYAVHLVSLSQADSAESSWRALQAAFPDLLSGKAAAVKPVDLGDQGIFYRLHAYPYGDAAAAEAACQAFSQRDHYCAPVAFD